MSIQGNSPSNEPDGTGLGTLVNPAALAGGGNLFTTSGADIDLSPDTTYWIVFESTSGGNGTVEMRRTADDGEDSVGTADWTIADDGLSRARDNTTAWNTGSDPHKVGIFGYAKTATAPPGQPQNFQAFPIEFQVATTWSAVQGATSYRMGWRSLDEDGQQGGYLTVNGTSHSATVAGYGEWEFYVAACNGGGCGDPAVQTVEVRADAAGQSQGGVSGQSGRNVQGQSGATTSLVSNIGQTQYVLHNLNLDSQAQGFTTGGSLLGYMLTSIDVNFVHTAPSSSLRVEVAKGLPGATAVVATLTHPASYSTGTLTFTVPGGIKLDPSTEYWVVLTGSNGHISNTASLNEDLGSADGWSVADIHYRRRADGMGGWTQSDFSLRIAVNGYDRTTKFVGNTEQTADTNNEPDFTKDHAQAFTTGSYAHGYKLHQLDWQIAFSGSGTPNANVKNSQVLIFTQGTAGPEGGTHVGTLTAVSGNGSFGNTVDSFTSSDGVSLNSNTTYYAVLDVNTANDGNQVTLETTAADDEDPGAAADWSIGNNRWERSATSNTWVTSSEKTSGALQIAVHGARKPSKFIGNTGQTHETTDGNSRPSFTRDHAQEFTTGSNSTGYTLHQVDYDIVNWDGLGDTTTTPFTVNIYDKSGSGNFPGSTKLGTLTASAANVASTPDTFKSSDGIELSPNTTYYAVIDVTGNDGSHSYRFGLDTTATNNEDSGALTGWSIAANRLERPWDDTAWASTDIQSNTVIQIAFHGLERAADPTAPTVTNVEFSGTVMVITFSENLRTTPPAAGSFAYKVGGVAQSAANSISIAGNQVTLTWSAAQTVTGTLTLDYTPPADTANPLQDADGNKVAAFTGQAVTATDTVTEQRDILVRNNGQTPHKIRDIINANFDMAQAFTTGSHQDGYQLTAVKIGLGGIVATTNPTFNVKVCTGNDSNPIASCPASRILENPDSFTTGSLNTFTPKGGSMNLNPGTYYLVLTTTAAGTGADFPLSTTNSGDEDQKAIGWSIANGMLASLHGNTNWVKQTDSWLMQVLGQAKVSGALTLESLEIDGTTLVLGFNREISPSTPAAGQFRIWVNTGIGSTWHQATGISVSGNRVILTVPAVTSGDFVRLTYSKPTAGNKLKDAFGNEVDGFVNQTVNNLTGVTASLSSAVIDGNQLTLTFDRSLKEDSGTTAEQFTVKVDGGTAQEATIISIDGKQVILTVPTVGLGQAVTASYAQPATSKLKDAFDGDMPAFTDQAVTNNTPIVSNRRQATPSAAQAQTGFGFDQVQPFTTGNNFNGGYVLSAVDLAMDAGTGTAAPEYTVSIRSANGDGSPGDVLYGTFTNPQQLSEGINTFTAPAGGIRLVSNRRYVLLVDVTSAGDSVAFGVTNSANEDPGASSGWGIENARLSKGLSTGSYSVQGPSLRMALRGTIEAADLTRPNVASIALGEDGTTITVKTDEKDLKGTLHAPNWIYTVEGVQRTPTSLTWNPQKGEIYIGVHTALDGVQVLTLNYDGLGTDGNGAGSISDHYGNSVSPFTNRQVENNSLVAAEPTLTSALASSRTLALVYNWELDATSVPDANDFTVMRDDRYVAVSAVKVEGKMVTLTLTSSVSARNVVTVSYTKNGNGNTIKNTRAEAFNLVNRAVSTADLEVKRAYINRGGNTVTIELSQPDLLGSYQNNRWNYRVNYGPYRQPTSGTFDRKTGTIKFQISPAVIVESQVGGPTVRVYYSPGGTASQRTRNMAGNHLRTVSNRELDWYIPWAGCTKGPGVDLYNWDSPCNPSPEARPDSYKSNENLSAWELKDPLEPQNVQLQCAPGANDCNVTWDHPEDINDWLVPGQSVTYNIYLTARLKQTDTCTEYLYQAREVTNRPHHDPRTAGLSTSRPSGLPSGCTIDQWVASVAMYVKFPSGGIKTGSSGLDFRDGGPPIVRRADLSTTAKTVTIDFDEDLHGPAPAASQFRLQNSAGRNLTATINSVTVSGTLVTLTFASIPDGAERIRYTPGLSIHNPLQDALGHKVTAFTRELL